MTNISGFQKTIRDYYRKKGRKMPWRRTRDPYRILVSEIMLQQTQVGRVTPFYEKFIKKFPNFAALAKARPSEILNVWQGLGYNRRALALKKLSSIVLEKFNGNLPADRETLESLPGIGPGTSGSLMVFAFNKPEIFIETNIRRVFIYFFFKKRKKVTDIELERYIKGTLDRKNPREWYWALMDYGATLAAKRPDKKKIENPNRRSLHYKKQSVFKGSDRELRGKMLRAILMKRGISEVVLIKELKEPPARVRRVAEGLCREGFIKKTGTIERKNVYFRIN